MLKKRIQVIKAELPKLTIEIQELEDRIKIYVVSLYKTSYRDLFFNKEGIFINNKNIYIDLNKKVEELNKDDVYVTFSSINYRDDLNSTPSAGSSNSHLMGGFAKRNLKSLPSGVNNIQKREYNTVRKNIKENNIQPSLSLKVMEANDMNFQGPTYSKKDMINKGINLNESNIGYLEHLNEIIEKCNNDLFKSQEVLEDEWKNYMINKLNDSTSQIRRNMSAIFKKSLETLNLHIENKRTQKRFISLYKEFNKNHLIIAFSTILSYHNKLGYTSIAMIIARNILIDIYTNQIKKNVIDITISFKEFIIVVDMEDEVNKLKLGSFFIDIFCHSPTPIFDKNYKKSELLDDGIDSTPISVLEINNDYLTTIENYTFIVPNSLPMICLPNKWSETEYGGFLSNKIIKEEIITGSKFHDHLTETKNNLYKAVNYFNSIKFKINKPLLKFLEQEGNIILQHYLETLDNNSEKLQAIMTLKIANSFSELTVPFYINTHADWRGRIYTQSFFITYQGSELSSSLIQYFEGQTMTESGLNYLYIYGANCYNENNISKKNFIDRINWVKLNYNKIISLDIVFILKAESVFLFTAFCLNMRELEKDKNALIYTPIFLDATCSGIQHLAGLLKDQEVGERVNLISQDDNEDVADIYSDLIKPINEAINQYGESHKDCESFKYIELKREHIKTPIMTKNYNVSTIGIANQLRSKFKQIHKSGGSNKNDKTTSYIVPSKTNFVVLNYYQVFILAQIIDEQIFKSLPSLKVIYNYFKDIIKLTVVLNIPCVWFTPSGLKLTQHYNISEQNKVSIRFGKSSNTVVLRRKTSKLDKKKQVQAIIPNIIHSLDASHLINLINTAISNKFNQIITVHDCFGSQANDVAKLIDLVKKEFILLYTQSNFLNLYHDRFIQSLKDNNYTVEKDENGLEYFKPLRRIIYLPKKPILGNLDIEKIINSKHFIT